MKDQANIGIAVRRAFLIEIEGSQEHINTFWLQMKNWVYIDILIGVCCKNKLTNKTIDISHYCSKSKL